MHSGTTKSGARYLTIMAHELMPLDPIVPHELSLLPQTHLFVAVVMRGKTNPGLATCFDALSAEPTEHHVFRAWSRQARIYIEGNELYIESDLVVRKRLSVYQMRGQEDLIIFKHRPKREQLGEFIEVVKSHQPSSVS